MTDIMVFYSAELIRATFMLHLWSFFLCVNFGAYQQVPDSLKLYFLLYFYFLDLQIRKSN